MGRVHERTRQIPDKSQVPGQNRDGSTDTSSGRVHVTGPDETSAGAGEVTETDTSRDHGSTRQDQISSRQRSSSVTNSGRVHETGPDETPVGAGEDRGTGRVQGEDQASSQQEASSSTSAGRVHKQTPAGAGEVRETGTRRDGSTGKTRQVTDMSQVPVPPDSNETKAHKEPKQDRPDIQPEPGPDQPVSQQGRDGSTGKTRQVTDRSQDPAPPDSNDTKAHKEPTQDRPDIQPEPGPDQPVSQQAHPDTEEPGTPHLGHADPYIEEPETRRQGHRLPDENETRESKVTEEPKPGEPDSQVEQPDTKSPETPHQAHTDPGIMKPEMQHQGRTEPDTETRDAMGHATDRGKPHQDEKDTINRERKIPRQEA